MITVVMTYYDRQEQLNTTLTSMIESMSRFNVIVVDDCSPVPVEIPEVPFDVKVITTEGKWWRNSEPAHNLGILHALKGNPDIIMLQSAECMHYGDVLKYAEDNVTDEHYISFGCFSLDEYSTKNRIIELNGDAVRNERQLGWYNHPTIRPVGLDFCSAITTKNLIKLNGFDERLSYGHCYGDNYFLHRVNLLGLQVEITDDPIVLHQWHKKGIRDKELIETNRMKYMQLKQSGEIRAKHISTNDF